MAARGKTSPKVVAGDWWTFLGFKTYKYRRSQASLALARRLKGSGNQLLNRQTTRRPRVLTCQPPGWLFVLAPPQRLIRGGGGPGGHAHSHITRRTVRGSPPAGSLDPRLSRPVGWVGRGPGRTAQLVPARAPVGAASPAPLPCLHFLGMPCHPVPDAGRGVRYCSRPFIRKTSLKLGELDTAWPRPKTKTKTGGGGAARRDPARTGAVPSSTGSGRPRLSLTVAGAARLRQQSPDSPQVRAVGRGPCDTSQRQSPSPRLTCAAQAHATQPGRVAGPPWALPALDFLGRRGGPAALSLSCGRGAPGGRLGPSPSRSSAPRFSRRPRSAPGSQTAMGAPPRGVAPPARLPASC